MMRLPLIAANAAILSVFLLANTDASASAHFQSPELSGNGCTADSADYVIAPDQQTLTIQFHDYSTASGSKHCNMSIPVSIPAGLQVSQLTTDYQVFVKGQGSLTRSYHFAGQTGPNISDDFNNAEGESYKQRDNLIAMSNIASQCGQNITIHISSQIRAKNSNSNITFGTSGTPQGITLYLQARSC